MVGVVTREHILQLLETLLQFLGGAGGESFEDSLRRDLEILSECISFMAKIHEDNPWLSKLLAKSFGAVQEIHQCVLDGPTGIINEVSYKQYSQFDPHRVLSPLCVKLNLVDPHVRQAKAAMMNYLSKGLMKITSTQQSEGTDLLLVPFLCMISDIMPHM